MNSPENRPVCLDLSAAHWSLRYSSSFEEHIPGFPKYKFFPPSSSSVRFRTDSSVRFRTEEPYLCWLTPVLLGSRIRSGGVYLVETLVMAVKWGKYGTGAENPRFEAIPAAGN